MRLPLGIAGVVALTGALGDVLVLTVSREVGLQGILPLILITGVAIVLGRQAAHSWISRVAFVGGTAAFLAIMLEVPLLYLATWLEAKTADGFVFYSLSPSWVELLGLAGILGVVAAGWTIAVAGVARRLIPLGGRLAGR